MMLRGVYFSEHGFLGRHTTSAVLAKVYVNNDSIDWCLHITDEGSSHPFMLANSHWIATEKNKGKMTKESARRSNAAARRALEQDADKLRKLAKIMNGLAEALGRRASYIP